MPEPKIPRHLQEGAADVAVLPAPMAPWKGAPLRVIVAAEKPIEGELSLIGPDGSVAAKSRDRQGGPPYFWYAEVASPAAGTWHATLAASGCGTITRDIAVRDAPAPPPAATPGAVWPVRACVEPRHGKLVFGLDPKTVRRAARRRSVVADAARRAARPLAQYAVQLSQCRRRRMATPLSPDCADFVYFLRAYFAFKMGLPFGYSNCSRGGGGKPPKCYTWLTNRYPRGGARPGVAAAFGAYLPVVGDAVQSGAVRTLANDNNTDFYTVPLTQETLRPGTVYADPYGHVLMLVRRVPQSGGAAGVFLAADAEPDGSVTRKRFWRGNFLFVHDPTAGQPGLQALPADRARRQRQLAAADQRRDREKSAIRRFLARTVAARRPKTFTIAWMT